MFYYLYFQEQLTNIINAGYLSSELVEWLSQQAQVGDMQRHSFVQHLVGLVGAGVGLLVLVVLTRQLCLNDGRGTGTRHFLELFLFCYLLLEK